MTAVIDAPFPISRLAAERRSRGLTQEQLGRQLGTRGEVISIIERAAQPGDLIERMIVALAHAEPAGDRANQ